MESLVLLRDSRTRARACSLLLEHGRLLLQYRLNVIRKGLNIIVERLSKILVVYFDSSLQTPGTALVLGAGNQTALADIVYALFCRKQTVYIKLHTLRADVQVVLEHCLAPLLQQHYLGMEVHSTNARASALVQHPGIAHVHLTGAKATYDQLLLSSTKKPITAELGAVTPFIVTPGTYTKNELTFQAKTLAYWMHHNASCNCNSPKVIILPEDWSQVEDFLQIVQQDLEENQLPVPYYPRSTDKRK